MWGAEPAGADDAFRSLAAGHLVLDGPTDTIADGLVAQLSERTLAILQAHAVQVVTVTEDQIVEAMVRLARDAKQMVEPSGAVALAGLVQMVAQARAGAGRRRRHRQRRQRRPRPLVVAGDFGRVTRTF